MIQHVKKEKKEACTCTCTGYMLYFYDIIFVTLFGIYAVVEALDIPLIMNLP